MKSFPFVSSILTLTLAVGSPALAHVGHGDEFQATGGVDRVQVNPATDQQLGILVTPITEAAPSGGVLIPVTALVDADGKQWVFVQYENFYEPVEVTTGATQGDLIEVSQGLSVGEQLVTQGSLMLYAQSRKTQPTEPAASSEPVAQDTAPSPMAASPQAATSVEPSASPAAPQSSSAPAQSGFPVGLAAGGIAGVALLLGALAVASRRKRSPELNSGLDKQTVSDKGGTY